MTAKVVNVCRRGATPPRAVQIPEMLTGADIDDVLYGFGFEYFGPHHGTQRLLHRSDDSIGDYGEAREVMDGAEVDLALFDRDQNCWVPLRPGDWVVEPQDERGDGFIHMRANVFADTYDVIA